MYWPEGINFFICLFAGMRLSSRYSIANVAQRAQWSSHWPRAPTTMASHTGMLGAKVKGKQLVDNETLSCLLVLLFVDEPRLNTGRLHRVLRNLCYHTTTRQWVIRVSANLISFSAWILINRNIIKICFLSTVPFICDGTR